MPEHRRIGPQHVLIACYLTFVIAAGGRSSVQLALYPHRALLAYVLSAVAAAAYATGLALLILATRRTRINPVARAWCLAELCAVLAVGTLSLTQHRLFPQPTVWSGYGAGYGFVPLLMPVLAWWWLRRDTTRRGNRTVRDRHRRYVQT